MKIMAEAGGIPRVDRKRVSHCSERDAETRNMEIIGMKDGTAQNVTVVGVNYGNVGSDDTNIQNLEEKTLEDASIWTDGLVRFSAVDLVIEKLHTGENWITITGNAGEGKTTLGYMVLETLKKTGHRVFKLDTPEDVIRVVRKRKESVIMLNDILGAFTFDSFGLSKWQNVIHSILDDHEKSSDKENQTRVLLISRRNVLEGARDHLGRYVESILDESRVIDLSKSDKVQEQLEIFDYYLCKSGISVQENVKERVASRKSLHGFPHCCKIYVELAVKQNDLDTEKFFASPLQFLDQTTKVLVKKANCFTLFKAMIMCNGKLDISRIEEEQRRDDIQSAISELKDSYLKESSGLVMFSHPSIYESVAVAVGDKDQVFFLQHASISVLMQKANIQLNDQDKLVNFVNVHPRSSGLETLVERFRLQILDKDFSVFRNSRLCENAEFCQTLVQCSTRRSRISFDILKKEKKIYINARSTEGDTMVNEAAESGNITAVGILVNYGADVNNLDREKDSVLHKVCYKDQPDVSVIELLLRNGANVNKADSAGRTPIHILCLSDPPDFNVMKLLIKNGADVNKADEDGDTVLHRLSYFGKLDASVMEMLLKNGADVNKVDNAGDTALHCLDYKKHSDTHAAFELLIKSGADVNKFDKDGDALLHNMCYGGVPDIGVLELLIQNGLDINKFNRVGKTALHILSSKDEVDICVMELLIKAGADVNISDKDGDTALQNLSYKKQPDAYVVELLVKNGTDVNTANRAGETALHILSYKDGVDANIMELLIKAGADVNKADKDGDTVLHVMSQKNQPNVHGIELLVSNGADVNKANKKGKTPLHCMCHKSTPCVDAIKLLIQHGADVKKLDHAGKSARNYLHKRNDAAAKSVLLIMEQVHLK